MARVEAGEGNKGREREWLARAIRGPRDRAWIADGYISDRWLPVSPVTGAVDAFEWKAPVDAIGRGDATLLIEESHEPPQPPEPPAPLKVAAPVEKVAKVEKVEPKKPELAAPRAVPSGDGAGPPRPATIAPATPVIPREQPAPARTKPELYVPPHAPDDPGVAATDTDESPASLERLRAAQIR
jgi:HemY protein